MPRYQIVSVFRGLFTCSQLFIQQLYGVCSNGFRESIDGTADDIDTKFAGSNSWRKSLMECGEACIIDSQCDMYQFSDIYWCKCLDKRECDCEWPAVRSSPSVKKPGTCSLARAVNRNVPTGETSFVVKWKQACIKNSSYATVMNRNPPIIPKTPQGLKREDETPRVTQPVGTPDPFNNLGPGVDYSGNTTEDTMFEPGYEYVDIPDSNDAISLYVVSTLSARLVYFSIFHFGYSDLPSMDI